MSTIRSSSQEHWLTSRQTAIRTLAYDGPPDAPSVVVVHGLELSTDVLREAVPGHDPYARLAAEGLNVLALDLPGHGRSGGRRGRLTYRLAIDAIATAAGAARERWGTPVAALGSGFGGVLAFYAALEESVLAAVVCNGVLDLRDVSPVLQRLRQGASLPLAGWLRRRLAPEALQRVRLPAAVVVADSDLIDDPELRRAVLRHPQTVRSYDLDALGSILLAAEEKPDIAAADTPTLVAVGSNDRALPETAARNFYSRLSCEKELWVLPGGGHQLLLEHTEAFVPVAASFLHTHLAGPA